MDKTIAITIAGSMAGIIEHISIYPLDTLRTRKQALNCKGSNFSNLWKGSLQFCSGIAPAHIAFYGSYELCKHYLPNNPYKSILTGTVASISHDLVMIPYDTAKQRVQIMQKSTIINQFKDIIAIEGVAGLYRSIIPTFIMNIPMASIFITINDYMKYEYFNLDKNINENNITIHQYMVSAAVAGTIGTLFTTPFDVIKTNVQTMNMDTKVQMQNGVIEKQAIKKSFINQQKCNILKCVNNIYNKNGLSGFYKGLGYRLIMYVPAVTISWTTYHLILNSLL